MPGPYKKPPSATGRMRSLSISGVTSTLFGTDGVAPLGADFGRSPVTLPTPTYRFGGESGVSSGLSVCVGGGKEKPFVPAVATMNTRSRS